MLLYVAVINTQTKQISLSISFRLFQIKYHSSAVKSTMYLNWGFEIWRSRVIVKILISFYTVAVRWKLYSESGGAELLSMS